ncbi:MAG TPA: Gfo/Idh/MocA family oxidoreductase [Roseiflexaceae bacterium]|nr:Gfo/Idh/MocA family oxidoreductase [Roseiflexaceae bacterium]
MTQLRVGIIGCGRPWRSEGASGFGMAHLHARGYARVPGVALVALADIRQENALAFQAEHGGERIYHDYRTMLERERLDVVSVCTWPALHAEMVIAAAEAGVRAIHCEKPMAPTYGESRRMAEICRTRGVQLTFNHQRRFGPLFRAARTLLRENAIGPLRRMEASCPNMFDWGTHWFDMFGFFNDETPALWVLGQVETRRQHTVFGVPVDVQGISQIRFQNGVGALLATGGDTPEPVLVRLVGDAGAIEIDVTARPVLRLWGHNQHGWEEQAVAPAPGQGEEDSVALGVVDLLEALATGREPELSAARALRATELIFATYESSRRRARIDLPLTIEDSPFLEMVGGI